MAARSTGSVSPLGRWPRLLRGLGNCCRVCAAWQDRGDLRPLPVRLHDRAPGWRSETGLVCHAAALDYQPLEHADRRFRVQRRLRLEQGQACSAARSKTGRFL